MAKDEKGRVAGELSKMDRFSSLEEEEAMALETLGVAGIAAMGPQVRACVRASALSCEKEGSCTFQSRC